MPGITSVRNIAPEDLKFNLFGSPTTNDIRVGYISPDRGYVSNVSICEANSYAKLNPGTTFIIKNRNRIEYKNINEVNTLRPEDVFVSAPAQGAPPPPGEECPGIQVERECGPVRAEFYGGGGVGVTGNPVIGVDGSVMAVHIVNGGHGYRYAPIVDIKDDCLRGAGASAVASIGQTHIGREVYSAEDEFEDYFPETLGSATDGSSIKQWCSTETGRNRVGHGRRWAPDGDDIGPWDPSLYVTYKEDPIQRQIQQFQEFLASLTDPWWFTRKENPIKVTSDNAAGVADRQRRLNINPNRTVHAVQHHLWGGTQTTRRVQPTVPQTTPDAFVSEDFQIYTAGGQGRGLQFTFTEVGGNHTFTVRADDYTDGGQARTLAKRVKPNVDYTVVSEGSHRGRDRATGTEQGLLLSGFGTRGVEKGLGTGQIIFADLLGSNNDNDDLQIQATNGQFRSIDRTTRRGHSNYELTYKLTVPLSPGNQPGTGGGAGTPVTDTTIAPSFMNNYAISPVPMSNAAGSDFAGMLFTMEWEEEFPHPGEYEFKAQCDNQGSFYLNNQQEIESIGKWNERPTVLRKHLDWPNSDTEGKVYKMRLDLLNSLEYRDVHIQAPTPPSRPTPTRTIICHAGGGKGGTDNQQQDVGGRVIVGQGGNGGYGWDDDVWGSQHGGKGGGAGLRNGQSANNPITHTQLDDMDFRWRGKKGGPGGYGVNFQGTQVGTIQQTVGTRPSIGGNGVAMGGGGGGNAKGRGENRRGGNGGDGGVQITWGRTGRSEEWTRPGVYNVTVPGDIATQGSAPAATARFEGTGLDDIHLVVSGAGSLDVELVLDTNDSWTSRGTALTEMRCGPITLTRTRNRRSETLRGSGAFSAGRYPVEIIGADRRARQPNIGSTRLELKDRHGDDVNASIVLRTGATTLTDGITIVCIGGGGSGHTDTDGDRQGSGGTGGAYAWINREISAGTRLRITVGRGGPGSTRDGSTDGGDSFVAIVEQPRPVPPPQQPAGIRVRRIFDTVSWMNRANRQLWRTNVHSNTGFINRFGVCPFDTSMDLEDNPYAGTHGIIWRNLEFPIDGNYTIRIHVDDSVTLRFNGPGGEVVIRKEGFPGGVPSNMTSYTRFFRRGTYTLQADLEQIPGGRFSFTHRDNNRVRNQEIRFRITSGAWYANRITIPGLFQVEKEFEGAQINENLMRMVEVGREYDVILTSAQRGTNFNSNNVRLRLRDGGRRLQMEEASDADWTDIQCTVSDGEFYQIRGNRCKFRVGNTARGINPMALAVDVEVAYATRTEVSARSWHQNPMGVALTIKAPPPPVPREDPPQAEGRCPNNPMWTTRFPANTQWYPVRFEPQQPILPGAERPWNAFLNRWAISPVLPLPHPGTDEGGRVFTNTWDIDVPYGGWYQLKGSADDIARYYVDDDLKLSLPGRAASSKFQLQPGRSTIRVEVENRSTITYRNVDRKIFSAKDWRRRPPVAPTPPTGGIICHAGGGSGGTDNQAQLNGGRVIVGQGGAGGDGGDDNWSDSHHGGKGGGAGLRSGGVADHRLTHTQIDALDSSRQRGGPGGFGVNFQGTQAGTIQQIIGGGRGGDGVVMGGGGGGSCGGGAAGSGGTGGVKITWGLTGTSQEWTTPGTHYVNVPGNIGRAGTLGGTPVTARFEGSSINDLHLVVSGTGTCECTLLLDTNDNYGAGHSVTEMRCGDIILTRTNLRRRTETLVGTGTFVGGRRYPIQITETGRRTGSRIVAATLSAGLFQRENISTSGVADTRIELDDDADNGFDINASINLRVSPGSQPMDGVTIVCIGGGGSGFMDDDGDRQGSGGAGGAYAWVNQDIPAGERLKIVVGRGGRGRTTRGGQRGGDSYVEIVTIPPPPDPDRIVQRTINQVSYNGPNLFHFTDRRWGKVMNRYSVSPANADADLDSPSPYNVGRKTLEWTNVNFPERGRYKVLFVADNKARLYINGADMVNANENYRLDSFNSYGNINISQPGRFNIKIDLDNVYHANAATPERGDDIFRNNPSGVALEIKKPTRIATDEGKSWVENPVGVAGILVPPPCPKEVGGKGVVTEVVVNDPGNGYPPPDPPPDVPNYPVVITLTGVRVTQPGINYNCGEDEMVITPDLGYQLTPICGPFGRIDRVEVIPPPQVPPLLPPPDLPPPGLPGIAPPDIDISITPTPDPIIPPPDQPLVPSVTDSRGSPIGFDRTPQISIKSKTGVNAVFAPILTPVVVPPIAPPPPGLIQVTDLAGIKRTGYYDGKAYYGAVFFKDGVKYAGWYETSGQLIQIYDTLQESIDATVTTPASAIQRQGSDVTSNDPRLNIPGTPDNLI